MTTGVQGALGCPWGCPNDDYSACDRNGSRESCNSTCCPAFVVRPGAEVNAVPVGHSPGPWRVADHGSGLGVRDALGRRVASLRYAGSSVSAEVPVGENIGNAWLIAAAPDLLAACRELFDAFDPYARGASETDLLMAARARDALRRAMHVEGDQ